MSIKSLYLLLVICIGLIFLGVGSTYAVFTASVVIDNPITIVSNLSHDSEVVEIIEVVVPSGKSTTATLNISNSNNIPMNYTTWYMDYEDDINVGAIDGKLNGTLNSGESSSVNVHIENNTNKNITVALGVSSSTSDIVLGSNMRMIDKINFLMSSVIDNVGSCDHNTTDCNLSFLGSEVTRDEILSVTFVGNNIVPDNLTGVDVSKDKDGSIMMWYTKNNDDLYDVYIGGKNRKVYLLDGLNLFRGLTKTEIIDFNSVFNTAFAVNMLNMFNGCHSLTTLNLSNFNTSNVKNMNDMFSHCQSLTVLDLSDLETDNVSDMNYMFIGCSSLTELDVSGFDTSKVTSMRQMFEECKMLTAIYVSDTWNTDSVTTFDNMFVRCINLIGGSGTTYDANHIDVIYARVDGGY